MPVDPEDTVRKETLYPDDLPGEGLVIREMHYLDAGASEDSVDLPDGAGYGWWLPVQKVGLEDGEGPQWAASPRALREALIEVDAEAGEAFRVTSLVEGEDEHDPYEVEIEYPYQP